MKIDWKAISSCCLAVLGLTALSASSQAADLGSPVNTVSAYNWTGFYVGADAGGAFGRTDKFDAVVGPSVAPHNVSGGVVGGFIGYSYQMQNIVVGAEADANWASYHGKTACPGAGFTCSTSANSLESIRGRFGYALDRILVYGTAGVGFGTFKYRTYVTATGADFNRPYNVVKVGYTLGLGLEYAVSDRWTLRGEYLYYGFGTNTDGGQLNGAGNLTRVRTDANVVRVGAAYKF